MSCMKNSYHSISFEKTSILDSYFIHRYIIIKYRSSIGVVMPQPFSMGVGVRRVGLAFSITTVHTDIRTSVCPV